MHVHLARSLFAGAVAAVALALPVKAQDWPQRQVTILVPFGAGGTTDIIARLVAERMQEKFGKPFVIENRAGAGGVTGTAAAARMPNDGYSASFVTVATHAINQFINPKLGYDPVKDFEPVGLVNTVANILVVHPTKVPAKTLPEFVAYLKANPNKLTFGSAGVGTSQHLAGELLGYAVGSKLIHVPFRSSNEITNSLVGGHIDLAFDNTAVMLPQVRAGNVRVLGVADTKRHPAMPEVPTIIEVLPQVVSTSWSGMVMPAGTPKPIVEAMAAELRRVTEIPAVRAKIEELGSFVSFTPTAEFGTFMAAERKKWGDLIQAIGIKPN